ncbi:hypothetical protein Tco_1550972, partial [Tanacetum coccineum]
ARRRPQVEATDALVIPVDSLLPVRACCHAGKSRAFGRARKLPFLECKQASDSPSSEGKGHSGATSRFWRSF